MNSPDHILPDLRGQRLFLRLVREGDAAYICALRGDPRYNTHLSAAAPSEAAQRDWITRYRTREAAGQEYYFAICRNDDGRRCGLVRVYDIRPGDARTGAGTFTWGSWILDDAKPPKAALDSALLVYRFGFEHLGLARAVFDVRRANARTLAFHDRFGARRTHEDAQDIFFELPADLARLLLPGHHAALDEE